MPSYALSTTKRKFHSILDSIANTSTTSLDANDNRHNASSTTTLAPSLEPYAKKLKSSRPTSTPVPPSSLLHARATSNRTLNSQTSTMTEEKKAPNFAPWDRNQFLSRLETFRHVYKWMSKPDEINEIQWAKRGWTCVAKETVGCVGGCRNEVVISLEPSREEEEEPPSEGLEPSGEAIDDYYDWREEAQKELVKRYTEMIVTEHDEGCLWRRKGCDDSIHRLPLVQHATTLQLLRHRYESLNLISSCLPSNISTPPTLNVSKLIPHLFHILHPTPQRPSATDHPSSPTSSPASKSSKTFDPPTINPRALTLAILGWQADTTAPIPGIANCETCYRRLGLWLYKSAPSSPIASPPSSPTSSPTSLQQASTPIITRLDPTSEHRDYCPWINIRSQTRTSILTDGDLPGWSILQNMVLSLRPPGGLQYTPSPVNGVGNVKGVAGNGTNGAEEGDVSKEEEIKTIEERDKERWARLKRLKQVFRIKKKVPKEGGGASGEGKKG
ncbi:MAG: hypothetical protein Q9169_007744 [Polycauliona sp. 2 TL-2023]